MLKHRPKTLVPFIRRFTGNELLDSLQVTDNDSIKGNDEIFL